jgi:hypothetical protein
MNWNKTNVPVRKGKLTFSPHLNSVGASGGCFFNGCGYGGMTHMNEIHHNNDYISVAYGIPAQMIKECIESHIASLNGATECPKTLIINSPISKLYRCNYISDVSYSVWQEFLHLFSIL